MQVEGMCMMGCLLQPQRDFSTLLLPPQCYAAFGMMPHTLSLAELFAIKELSFAKMLSSLSQVPL
jgi:hypothetical protein